MRKFFTKLFDTANSDTLRRSRRLGVWVALGWMAMQTGCSSLTTPISGVPARRLPPQFFATPKNNLIPIDIARLAQEPPREKLVGAGDVLGVYVEGILPFTPLGEPPVLPPSHFPEKDSTLPPSMGFPITVVEDGENATISLPLIDPLPVKDLTVDQVRKLIRKAYLDSGILTERENQRLTPLVTRILMRTVAVVVVRQDIGGEGSTTRSNSTNYSRASYVRGADESASGSLIKLEAYQNDVLHALMASGGLPGVNAKNEVTITRPSVADRRKRDEFIRNFYAQQQMNQNPCLCPAPVPEDPTILRIPLRLPPGVTPMFKPEDIILEEGDIVTIESRDSEVFYTGGLLPGGEWPIPRDYDLDALGAMAQAGSGVASKQTGGAGFANNFALSLGGVPPGALYILRKTPCNGQVAILVDLAKAINDPRERPLIQPGDTLILQYKPCEELINFGIGTFFTYGIQRVFSGN